MREPGRVFSRTELCERVWQREHEYDTKLVEVFVGKLRKKLDEGSDEPLIRTVRHLGYVLPEESST
jgi:two-component system OmpR family response regulator/two-component system copper resistance phosphate regulon response regulator CusR